MNTNFTLENITLQTPLDFFELFARFNSKKYRNNIALYFLNSDLKAKKKIYKKTYASLFMDICLCFQNFASPTGDILSIPGQKIGVIGSNCYEWILSFFSIVLSGNKAVLIDYNLPPNAIFEQLNIAGCKIAFMAREVYEKCSELDDFVNNIKIISFRSVQSAKKKVPDFYDILDPLIEEKSACKYCIEQSFKKMEKHRLDRNEECIYIFTSGTTSNPKAAALTANNFLSLTSILRKRSGNYDDVFLAFLPYYHVLGLISGLIYPLTYGISITIFREYTSAGITRAIKETNVTVITLVPAVTKMLYNGILANIELTTGNKKKILQTFIQNCKDNKLSIFDKFIAKAIKNKLGSSLRLFVVGGAKANPAELEFFRYLGISVSEGYGLTETAGVVSCQLIEDYKHGSVGPAFENIEVILKNKDPDGNGEIWIKGPMVFNGYIINGKQDRSSFDENNFFNTGDIGYLDSKNNIFISGRKKDIIVLPSGKNVFPDELEMHYSQCKFIKEICVVGINNDDGENVHAVIFPDLDYYNLGNFNYDIVKLIDQDIKLLSQGLPSYKIIQNYTIVDEELPKTTTRKIKKREVLKLVGKKIDLSKLNSNNIKENNKSNILIRNNKNQIAFLFPGQGSQKHNMLQSWNDENLMFQKYFLQLKNLFNPESTVAIEDIIFPKANAQCSENTLPNINSTNIAQPALGLMEATLINILQELNIKPDWCVGHSYGELPALYAANFIDLPTLASLTLKRGELLAKAGKNIPGGMLALNCSFEQAQNTLAKLKSNIQIANINSPSQIVVGGSNTELNELQDLCKQDNIKAIKLSTSCAFHTRYMEPIKEEWQEFLAQTFAGSNFSISNTANVVANADLERYSPDLNSLIMGLSAQVTSQVNWVQIINNLYAAGVRIFIEVGPGKVLTQLMPKILPSGDYTLISLEQNSIKALDALMELTEPEINITEKSEKKLGIQEEDSMKNISFQEINSIVESNSEILKTYLASVEKITLGIVKDLEAKERNIAMQQYLTSTEQVVKHYFNTIEKIMQLTSSCNISTSSEVNTNHAPNEKQGPQNITLNKSLDLITKSPAETPLPKANNVLNNSTIQGQLHPKSLQIQDWVCTRIAEFTGYAKESLDLTQHFDQFGLDSISMMDIFGALLQENPELNAINEKLFSVHTIQDLINTIDPEIKKKLNS